MGLIATLHDWTDGDILTTADLEGAFAAIRDVVNTYGVLTDTARTISVTNIWSATQTFTGGWTAGAACTISSGGFAVSSGTTAVQALTATTGTFTSTVQTAGAIRSLASTVDTKVYSDSGNSYGVIGTISDHDLLIVRNGVTQFYCRTNSMTLQNNLTVSGTLTVSSTLGVGGAATLSSTLLVTGAITASSTINGQTISASASFSGTLTVAGATTLAALSCTTLSFSGVATFAATPVFQADLDLTTSGSKLLVNGTNFVLQNSGGTSIYARTTGSGSSIWLGYPSSGDVILGGLTVNSDTRGYVVLPSFAGAMVATPSGGTGVAYWDTTNKKFKVYSGGTWYSSAAFT